MSNYTKTTDFEAKDSLPTGDSGKIIRGSEFETEFDAISTAIATKADTAGPTFTGTATFATTNATTVQIGGVAVTSTAAELNTLDGITSTTAELNKLDGFTGTVDDLNYAKDLRASGVTAAEFDILDGLTATATELNILDGATLSTAELNLLDGVTSTTAELNILDGVTATTAELNYVDGVTSAIQTQIDTKAPTASPTFTGTVTVPGLTTTADVSFGDNDKAVFGAGSDLQIYHDGSDSIVKDAGTGNLKLQGSSYVVIQNTSGTNMIRAQDGAAVRLYHNGSEKLDTTSTGVDVTGTVTADGLTVGNGTQQSRFYIDADEVSQLIDGNVRYDIWTGGDKTMRLDANGDISFYEDTGTTAKFFWDASAESLGIGTSEPSTTYSLDATKPMRISSASPAYELQETDATNQRWSVFGLGGDLTFRDITNNVYAMTLKSSSGNVGIGTSSPDTQLHVYGTGSGASTYGPAFTIGKTNGPKIVATQENVDNDIQGLSFFTKSSGLQSDPAVERLRIDSDGNVGIGTSSPANLLHVKGASAGSLDLARFRLEGATNNPMLKIEADEANQTAGIDVSGSTTTELTFSQGGAERMRIDSSGRVGIGTSAMSSYSSSWNDLVIDGGTNSGATIVSGTTGDGTIGFADGTTGNEQYRGYIQYRHSSDLLKFGTSGTEQMVIDSSGKVGIGTSSPTYEVGLGDSGGTERFAIDVGSIQAESIHLAANNRHLVLDASGPGSRYVSFKTGATAYSGSERMRIDSSGNVGIGTSSPSSKLEVEDGDFARLDLNLSNATGTTIADVRGLVAGTEKWRIGKTSSSSDDFAVNVTGTERLRIDSSGNVGIGTNSPIYKFEVSDGTRTGVINPNATLDGIFIGVRQAKPLILGTNDTERMRIDASGNLLVGQTSADSNSVGIGLLSNGTAYAVRDGSAAFIAHRKSSDGNIVEFLKDNTTVGSIGTVAAGAADQLYIVSDDVGLRFRGSDDSIVPVTSAGAFRDGSIDLGKSTGRFKDLYLSGDVIAPNIVASNGVFLGGTSSANKLDDYETGTWTPIPSRFSGGGITATYTSSGNYIKVGKEVTIFFNIVITAITGQGSSLTYIGGLPFSPADSYISSGVTGQRNGVATAAPIIVAHSDSRLYLRDAGANALNLTTNWQVGELTGSITYRVA